MKQILILAALLLSINFAQASINEATCPEGTKTLLKCQALSDSYIASVAVCLDQNKKISLQLEIKGSSVLAILENANETIRAGSTFYKGPDFVLSRFPAKALENGSLEIEGLAPVALSCF